MPRANAHATTARGWRHALALLALVGAAHSAWAQGAPFACDAFSYQTRAGNGQTALLRLPTTVFTAGGAAQNVYGSLLGQQFNAMGVRRSDGFIYALEQAQQQPRLFRLGQTGAVAVGNVVTSGGQSPALNGSFVPTGGTFDLQGRYYFVGQDSGLIAPAAVYRVDSFNASGGNLPVAAVYALSAPVSNIGDIAFGPDGNLYGATDTSLYQLRLVGNQALVTQRTIANVGGIGSSFFDNAGNFYVFANSSGMLSRVSLSFGAAFATSPVSSAPVASIDVSGAAPLPSSVTASDGASCPEDRADMQASWQGLPPVLAPGSSTQATALCTNAGPAAARQPSCNVSSSIPGATVTVGACTPALPLDALRAEAGQNTLSCPVTIAVPANPANSNSPVVGGTLTVTAGSASPDPNAANNSATASVGVIDAVDDAAASVSVGQSISLGVLGNDGVGSAAATTSNVSLSVLSSPGLSGPSAPSVSGGNLVVPASAPPGRHTITYQICALPAQSPPACDSAQVVLTVEGADMAAQTTLPAEVLAGQPVTVSGSCTSRGPVAAAAPGCALSGLPVGTAQSCTPSPPPNPLTVGDLITCTATFVAPASGTLNITTTASTSTPETSTANNTDTRALAPAPRSDMVATASGFAPNAPAGSTAGGTITCTNNGPSAAAAPSCAVSSLPLGATVSCLPSPAPNPLAVGASITCSVAYTVPASGGITVTGVAGSTTPDPNPANNSAQASSQSAPLADLRAQTTAPATVNAGQTFTASGTCTNDGPSAAALPSCALSGLPAGTLQSCSPAPTPASLAVGASITCSANVLAPGQGPLAITTVAGSATADPNNANNADTRAVAIAPRADMTAALPGWPASAAAGSTVTAVAQCTNAGPSAALNASCAVSGLPAGASLRCAPATPVGNLAPGAAVMCDVSFVMPASGAVTALATAGSSTPDPQPANNTAQASVTVSVLADLRAVTTVPPNVSTGDMVTVTGVCTNAGPSPAAGASCTLAGLPVGVVPSCTAPPQPLAVGQGISCSASFAAPASGPLDISTTAAATTPDPELANNVDTQPLAISPRADLQATVSGFPASANAGDPVNGSVTCTNNGPSVALNPRCSVSALPVGATIACTPDPRPATLAVGASLVCGITYTAPANAAPVTVTGVASADTVDPLPANNTAQATTNPVPQSDLRATTTLPASVGAGQVVNVSGVCSNLGPSPASGASCTLLGLPAGTAQTCTPAPVPEPLAVGAAITCSASFTAPSAGSLAITTKAGSTTADPNLANNSDTQPLNLVAQADLQVAVSGLPASPAVGSVVAATVICTNLGPSPAANASCTPSGLPAGATVSCSPASPTAVLGVGAALTCSVGFVATDAGTPITLVGTAASTTADPVSANNSAQQSTTPVAQADLQVVLSGFPRDAAAGSVVNGSAVCSNNGPSEAASPACTVDALPPGATVACSPSPAPATLAVGGQISCSVSFTVPATGAVTVSATASATTADPLPGNNRAVAPVTTSPLADMTAQWSGLPPAAAAGASLSGTLTCTNNGPSAAANPSCQPVGLPAGATVNCSPAPAPSTLAVGASLSCAVSFVTSANGPFTVVGVTSTSTADPDGANNLVSAPLAVIDAVNDTTPAPLGGGLGGVAIANVLANDSLSGSPATLAQVSLRQVSSSQPGVNLNPATGEVLVAPFTPTGSHTLVYEICTRSAPAACDTATATVNVGAAPIDATDDPPLVVGPGGGSLLVLGNDTLGGQPVQPAQVNLVLTANGGLPGLSLDANGRLLLPPGTPAGSYIATYQICERLNPANCDTANVPVLVQGAIGGSVWLDLGSGSAGVSDRQRQSGEPGLAGWVVEVLWPAGSAQAGQVARTPAGEPATATTDASGRYEIPGLPPGDYQLRFRAPAAPGGSGGSTAGPVWGTPVNGEQNNPQVGSVLNNVTRTLDISVAAGAGLAQQSLPVDPSGVIYDAVVRIPVAGATVTLLAPDGQPLAAQHLLPGQQGQTVIATGAAAGAYRFDLLPTAPTGVYTLRLSAPSGYTVPSSFLPAAGVLALQPGPGVYRVVPSATAPAVGEPTTHHLAITLDPAAGSADVIHNHIPLDPNTGPLLAIEKRANVTRAEVGDLVRYTIRVRNLAAGTLPALVVSDQLPPGFAYVAGTTRRAGTPVVALPEPGGAPGPRLSFALGALAANQTFEFSYHVKLGVAAPEGDGTNRAFVQSGAVRSLTAQAAVRVGGGVFRAEACFVGKIFSDCGNSVGQGNGNGLQDAGEPGIPGVRFYLEDGTSVTSDAEGKYSLCGLNARTRVLKVDETTLPPASRLGTTANRNAGDPGSLFVDLKKGELAQADFRNMSCSRTVADEIERRRKALRERLRDDDVNAPNVMGKGRTGPGLGLESTGGVR